MLIRCFRSLFATAALTLAALADADNAAPACSNVETVRGARAVLEQLVESDQALRLQSPKVEEKFGADSPEFTDLWARQTQIDVQNMACLERIVARLGWPGITQFGERAAESAFLILQHSDLAHQKKFAPAIRKATARGEAKKSALVLLEDRMRIREGRKQIYGSQITRDQEGHWEPHPIDDEAHVDERRAAMGLVSMAEYLQQIVRENGGDVSRKWAAPKSP